MMFAFTPGRKLGFVLVSITAMMTLRELPRLSESLPGTTGFSVAPVRNVASVTPQSGSGLRSWAIRAESRSLFSVRMVRW